MKHRRLLLATMMIGLLSTAVVPALTQPNEEPQQTPQPESAFTRLVRNLDRFDQVLQASRQTLRDWDHYAFALRIAMERLWQQHGATTESDLFARDLAIEMAQVPPWQLRGNRAMGNMIQWRYGLTDEQRREFMESVNRAAVQTFLRNTDSMLTIAREMAAGGGLTGEPAEDGERLMRWAKLAGPIRTDMLRCVEAEMPHILAMMDPGQQRLARQDIETFRRWHAHGGRIAERWLEGRWSYEDLGLSHEMFDPQWLGSQMLLRAAASQRSATTRVITAEPADGWTAYVQAFIRRHDLNAAQRQTAASILRELQHRATGYMLSHRLDLQELDRKAAAAPDPQRREIERDRSALLQPVEGMFQELKDRLETLPTAAQRAAATGPTSPAARPVRTSSS